MKIKNVLVIGLVVFLLTITLAVNARTDNNPCNGDPCSPCSTIKAKTEIRGIMRNFWIAFCRPDFLSEDPLALMASWKSKDAEEQIFASYSLNDCGARAVKEQRDGEQIFSKGGPLKLGVKKNLRGEKREWCFVDNDLDGYPDLVNDSYVDRLPKKIRKKLVGIFRKSVKKLTVELEGLLMERFGLK